MVERRRLEALQASSSYFLVRRWTGDGCPVELDRAPVRVGWALPAGLLLDELEEVRSALLPVEGRDAVLLEDRLHLRQVRRGVEGLGVGDGRRDGRLRLLQVSDVPGVRLCGPGRVGPPG